MGRSGLTRIGMVILKGFLAAIILWNGLAASQALAQPGRGRPMDNAAQYGWHSNYQEAKALAKKSGLPLMVVFRCIP